MPESWDESVGPEVAGVLAESRSAADAMLDLAHDLEVKLPGTRAAFRDGILRQSKVAIIARATAVLDPAEARAAERLVLDRAGRLTPGALRAAIARAVMEVAPKKARKRREVAAKFARVERWAEDSGNAALAGRELPPDEVFAVEQRIAWWAGELKKAGLEGGTDEIRARAYLDLLLGGTRGPAMHRRRGSAGWLRRAGDADRAVDDAPAGLADRPGEIPGIGPIDPDPRANTPDRYQAITRELGPDAGIDHKCYALPARPAWLVQVGGQVGEAAEDRCPELLVQMRVVDCGVPGCAVRHHDVAVGDGHGECRVVA